MTLLSYKELNVWQKSIILVDEIYKLTRELPKEEMFGLVSQMRRAAISIPSNIAEGYRRNHTAEYRQFLAISFGSASELETQLIITSRQYSQVNTKIAEQILEEVLRMLNSMMSKINK